MNAKNVAYFHSFGIEHIPKAISKFIGKKNIYRIQAYDSIMCGHFCISLLISCQKAKVCWSIRI